MNIPQNAERVALTIGGFGGVLVPVGFYQEGHTCTKAEAHVLGQIFNENLRNNLREKVKATVAEGGTKEEIQARVQKLVDDYVQQYEFQIGGGGGGFRTVDPIEAEMMHIARKSIKDAGQKKNITFTAKELTEKARELIEHEQYGPVIRKRAEREIAARAKEEDMVAGLLVG